MVWRLFAIRGAWSSNSTFSGLSGESLPDLERTFPALWDTMSMKHFKMMIKSMTLKGLCQPETANCNLPLKVWKWKLVTQSYLPLHDTMDCKPPGSSVHRIIQARILECVPISFSRKSSQPRDQIWVYWIASRLFTKWATREAPVICLYKS